MGRSLPLPLSRGVTYHGFVTCSDVLDTLLETIFRHFWTWYFVGHGVGMSKRLCHMRTRRHVAETLVSGVWTRLDIFGHASSMTEHGLFCTRFRRVGHVWTRTICGTRWHLVQTKRSRGHPSQKQQQIMTKTHTQGTNRSTGVLKSRSKYFGHVLEGCYNSRAKRLCLHILYTLYTTIVQYSDGALTLQPGNLQSRATEFRALLPNTCSQEGL